MRAVFTFLARLLWLLFRIIAVLLVLLVLLLLIPIAYSAEAECRDPDGCDEMRPEVLAEKARVFLSVTWLFGVLSWMAFLEQGEWKEPVLSVFGRPVRRRKRKKTDLPEKETGSEAKESGSERIRRILGHPDVWYVLKKTLGCIRRILSRSKPSLLSVQGRFDLLDYEWNSLLAEVLGILSALTPMDGEYEILYGDRFMINGCVRGQGRIIVLLCLIQLLPLALDRRCRAFAGSLSEAGEKTLEEAS